MKYEFYTILKEEEDCFRFTNWIKENGLSEYIKNMTPHFHVYKITNEIKSNTTKRQKYSAYDVDQLIHYRIQQSICYVVRFEFEAPLSLATIFKLTFNTTSIDNIINEVINKLKEDGVKFKKKQQ